MPKTSSPEQFYAHIRTWPERIYVAGSGIIYCNGHDHVFVENPITGKVYIGKCLRNETIIHQPA